MASIRKHGRQWRAEVYRDGQRRSKVLPTKQAARDWAAQIEYQIQHRDKLASEQPLGDVLDRYAREVSPTKRGGRWEIVRLAKLGRDPLAKIRLCDLRAQDIADWRDRRLNLVSAGSVRREMVLMSAVLTMCRREWGLLAESPMSDVRYPPPPPPRSRLPTDDEFDRLAWAAGTDLTKSTARAYHAFRFSCETAMRAGEIVGLRPDDIDGAVARLAMTKNGTAREVPLSSRALDLLSDLPALDPVFGLNSAMLDALWRKVRDRAGVEGLTFHDGRAYGTTQLSRRVDVLTLAKITGHRDIRMLSNVYYRESAESIAGRLG